MNNTLLSKLTLIIPTFNRQAYALRNMRYWSGREAIMHVFDGSFSAIAAKELSGLDDNIYYHHLPISMVERLKRSIDFISTEYTALMCDDEFYIPSALDACIRELEVRSDLVSCMGRCIRFNFTKQGITGTIGYPVMENYTILQNDPIERMVAHMYPYIPSTIYSVVRSTVWKRSLSTFLQKEFSAFAIGELQFELAVCYQGKSMVIPKLMWLRSMEGEPIRGNDPSLIPENTFQKWWNDPAKQQERSDFLNIMGAILAETVDKIAELSAGVKKALDVYVQGIDPKLGFTKKIKQIILCFLPASLQIPLKSILCAIRKNPLCVEKSIVAVAKDMADTGVYVDFQELSKIESIVLAFHSNKQGKQV